MDEKEVKKVKEVFNKLDKDNLGILDAETL